mmetsp:Transcript_34866/g.89202  ORF Transcript_34866/g.89202 Transcript_34866/m.89202 type:complete len:209 (-) Transcript_34866:2795-3421(-)
MNIGATAPLTSTAHLPQASLRPLRRSRCIILQDAAQRLLCDDGDLAGGDNLVGVCAHKVHLGVLQVAVREDVVQVHLRKAELIVVLIGALLVANKAEWDVRIVLLLAQHLAQCVARAPVQLGRVATPDSGGLVELHLQARLRHRARYLVLRVHKLRQQLVHNEHTCHPGVVEHLGPQADRLHVDDDVRFGNLGPVVVLDVVAQVADER